MDNHSQHNNMDGNDIFSLNLDDLTLYVKQLSYPLIYSPVYDSRPESPRRSSMMNPFPNDFSNPYSA